jgi:hypothetical protein
MSDSAFLANIAAQQCRVRGTLEMVSFSTKLASNGTYKSFLLGRRL